jgi:hypothetical protein
MIGGIIMGEYDLNAAVVEIPVPDVNVYSVGIGSNVVYFQVIVCARDIESAIKRALDVTGRTSEKVAEVKRLYSGAYIG